MKMRPPRRTEMRTVAVSYRIWPPVALGVPLVTGLIMSAVVGDPWDLPEGRLAAGLALAAAFAVWNSWGLGLLAAQRTGILPGRPTSTLIQDGPYAVSRNPLYLGLLALYVAVGLLAPSAWALLLTPLAVAAVDWGAIRPEEAHLRAQFGDAYLTYTKRVRRWI
jgi:protein-S-isoprenylcysteine O-methyltransferase Ste14